jgi:putative component of membrane protein insertase Oxa1/YidC/SpoIIIJ protein YidD
MYITVAFRVCTAVIALSVVCGVGVRAEQAAVLTEQATSLGGNARAPELPEPQSFARPLLLGAIRIYQRVAAPIRMGSCPMEPSCSRFAYQAFSTYSPARAYLLTADRLHRCSHDLRRYRVSAEDPSKLADPVPLPKNGRPIRVAEPRTAEWPSSGFAEKIERLRDQLRTHDTFGPIASSALTDLPRLSEGQTTTVDRREEELSPELRQLRFADDLRAQGLFSDAIIEYRRFLSFYPMASQRTQGALALFGTLRQNGQQEDAVRWGSYVLESRTVTTEESTELRLTIGQDLMMLGNGPRARTYFAGVAAAADPAVASKARLLEGLSFARDADWKRAEQIFRDLEKNSSPLAGRAATLAALAAEGARLPRKNPKVAGLLGLIPGLGYLYDGYPQTAISSLIVNGLFMAGTYKAFSSGNKPLGTVLGLFTLGWYGGNVTGSVSSARRRNSAALEAHLLKFNLGFRY